MWERRKARSCGPPASRRQYQQRISTAEHRADSERPEKIATDHQALAVTHFAARRQIETPRRPGEQAREDEDHVMEILNRSTVEEYGLTDVNDFCRALSQGMYAKQFVRLGIEFCKVACPPKGGLLSRGFDPASYPTVPLGSYHVLPTTT